MKNKKSLFKKLFLIFIVSYCILGLLLFIGARKYVHSANLELFTNELSSNAKLIMPLIKEHLSVKDYSAVNNMVRGMASDSNNRITVTDLSGDVIADSENDASSMANHLNRKEIKDVAGGKDYGTSVRYSSTVQENMLYMALPVKIDGELSAVLRLSVRMKQISLFTDSIFKNMIFVFIVIGILAVAVSYAVSKKISSGISRLGDAAKEIASGKFGVKADVGSDDEIGWLAESFNKMSDEISVLFNEVNSGREMLAKVLASVSDGILMADKSGKTVLFNDAFKAMFPDACEGRYFWEFLRSKEIEESLKNMSAGSGLLQGEFQSGTEIFSFAVSKVKDEDKFVISLKDITRFKQLDDLKKDFITNASHELKTPVTAIIGFSETLEEENLPEESRHYASVIKKQAQRLSNIVNDLLSLSSFENFEGIDKKELNISGIIDNVINFYRKKASQKGIKIVSSAGAGLKSIYANEFNMEQLLVNLVDNALKYTETGEININAENSGDGFVRLSVSDTGIGIAKECLPRIFERFYVVDKSRSKKNGGTGLGLSIVKHIVQSHGGKIFAESVEGAGSSFIVMLPVFK